MSEQRTDKIREGYDRLAAEYTSRIAGELRHKPLDRALLDSFARVTAGRGPVLDLGCGPGHVAAYLHERGVTVTGIDLSAGMIAHAEALHPNVAFRLGSMSALDNVSTLAGIVAFYSIIHIDREFQPAMFANWRRALKPDGLLLVSFHLGDADRHLDELWGQPIEIDFLFFSPEEIVARLEAAGFTVFERHVREPYAGVEAETRRCYLLARTANPKPP